ncbi:MAG: hypothetical protein L0G69_10215, partial [Brevibacterium sp.]|nr:hypothetical protein [Brevibacterium sp.]
MTFVNAAVDERDRTMNPGSPRSEVHERVLCSAVRGRDRAWFAAACGAQSLLSVVEKMTVPGMREP